MRRLPLVLTLAAVALLIAACTEPVVPLPTAVETYEDVISVAVTGNAAGPLLHVVYYPTDPEETVNPYPVGQNAPIWYADCGYAINEAEFPEADLDDAWDRSYLYLPNWIQFEPGTLVEYSDGTLILSCIADNAPAGLTVKRHIVFPGAGAQGRFMVDVIDLVGTSATPVSIADLEYSVNDGADESSTQPWQDYGTIGAFAWATKDRYDLDDPAIGLLPLLSTKVEADAVATSGDDYYVVGADGAVLGLGQRAVIAMVAGIRGDFEVDDLAGKNASMQALGAELAPLAGGAFCASQPPAFYLWAKLLPAGIADAICQGYAALD